MPQDDVAKAVAIDPSMDAIVGKTRRLIELGPLIARAIIEWEKDKLARYFAEFVDLKTRLQRALVEPALLHVPGPALADVRRVLKKIAAGELLPIEQALSGGALRDALRAPLTDDDFDELGLDCLSSWMSHIDFAKGLYRAGALIVGCGQLPRNLERFAHEARQCFAFQQYNAVTALCRAMLEIAVRDLAIAYCIIPRDDEKVLYLAARGRKPQGPDLRDMIQKITEHSELRHLRNQFHAVRRSTNAIIHGSRSVGENEALRVLKETLSAIHRLYEAHDKPQNSRRR